MLLIILLQSSAVLKHLRCRGRLLSHTTKETTEKMEPIVFSKTFSPTPFAHAPARSYLTFELEPAKVQCLVVKVWSIDNGYAPSGFPLESPSVTSRLQVVYRKFLKAFFLRKRFDAILTGGRSRKDMKMTSAMRSRNGFKV
ncbi:hypothetical protein NXS19_008013 [Fusarium pseudograminearum]|nr:hypothetical protein NXS19_008013 [Fusarium pseudograminearum]